MPNKSVFIFEHPEYIDKLDDYIDSGSVIVAMRPSASYALERNKIPHKNYYDYYDFEEFYDEVGGAVEKVCFEIANICDLSLRKIKKNDIYSDNHFYYNSQFIKDAISEIFLSIFIIDKILYKEKPDIIMAFNSSQPIDKIPGKASLEWDGIGYGSYNDTVHPNVMPSVALKHNIQYKVIGTNPLFQELLKPSSRLLLRRVIRIFKNKFGNIYSLFSKVINIAQRKEEFKLLSVGCIPIDSNRMKFINNGWVISNVPAKIINNISFNKESSIDENLFSELIESLYEFNFQGVPYFNYIQRSLLTILESVKFFTYLHDSLESYIVNMKPDLVGFSTHNPSSPETILLPLICEKHDIKHFCWAHGFYSANETHSGYSLRDLLYTKNYLVYGNLMKEFFDTQKYQFETHIAVPPELERFRQKYKRREKKRKVILYVLTALNTNKSYTDLNIPSHHSRYWEEIKKIIKLLSSYAKEYRVILRPQDLYGHDIQLIEDYLYDLKDSNIEIATQTKFSLHELYSEMDVCILNWFSTTMIEAACTDADIFMYGGGDLTQPVKDIISNRVFWSKEITIYLEMLRKYLDSHDYYVKSKNKSFLNELLSPKYEYSQSQVLKSIL